MDPTFRCSGWWDARRWSPRFRDDTELYREDDTAVLPRHLRQMT